MTQPSKKAEITVRLSEFEIPPMQDILLVGKKAPIGPEAVRHMVDALSPEQYIVVEVNHAIIEALVVRKSLLRMITQEQLVPFLLQETEKIISEGMVIKAQLNVTIQVSRVVNLL
ncbi:MAG: hypothetical protein STSR0004_11250 [Peptococcaceae bacterium]